MQLYRDLGSLQKVADASEKMLGYSLTKAQVYYRLEPNASKRRLLKKRGAPKGGIQHSKRLFDRGMAREMRREGYSDVEIARKFLVSRQAINRALGGRKK